MAELNQFLGGGSLEPAPVNTWADWNGSWNVTDLGTNQAYSQKNIKDTNGGRLLDGATLQYTSNFRAQNNTPSGTNGGYATICNVSGKGYLLAAGCYNSYPNAGYPQQLRVTIDGVMRTFDQGEGVAQLIGAFSGHSITTGTLCYSRQGVSKLDANMTDSEKIQAQYLIDLGGIRFDTSLKVEARYITLGASHGVKGFADYILDGEV